MQHFFRRKDVDLLDNNEDDNSNIEYWEFLELDQVELWSIALVPIIDYVHFKAKLYTIREAMPLSANERVKDVVHYKHNIVHIHCKMTEPTPYFSTICLNNSISPFSTPSFKNLNGSVYEPLIKDVERDIDRKL